MLCELKTLMRLLRRISFILIRCGITSTYELGLMKLQASIPANVNQYTTKDLIKKVKIYTYIKKIIKSIIKKVIKVKK